MVTQGLKAQAPTCISHWWNNFDFGMHCLWKELSIWEVQFMIVMTYISTRRAISCQHEKEKKEEKKSSRQSRLRVLCFFPLEKLVKIEFVIWWGEILPWLLFCFPHWKLDAHRCFKVFGRWQNSVTNALKYPSLENCSLYLKIKMSICYETIVFIPKVLNNNLSQEYFLNNFPKMQKKKKPPWKWTF